MSGTREKFNAVFFAAIMVLSMVAFSTAFVGSAAAVNAVTGDDASATVNTTNDVSEYRLNTTVTDGTGTVDLITVTDTAGGTFDLSGVDGHQVLDDSGTNVSTGINVVNADTVEISLNDEDFATDDEVNITLSGVVNPETSGDYTVQADFSDGGTSQDTASADVTIESSLNADLSVPKAAPFGSEVTATATFENVGESDINAENIEIQRSGTFGAGETLDSLTATSISAGENVTLSTTFNTTDLDGTSATTVESGNIDATVDDADSTDSASTSETLTVGTDDNGAVEVEVSDTNNNAVDDVDLILYQGSEDPNNIIATGNTGNDNFFRFDGSVDGIDGGLAVGTSGAGNAEEYVVKAEKEGFEAATRSALLDTNNVEGTVQPSLQRIITPDDISVTFEPSQSVSIENEITATVSVTTDDKQASNGLPIEDTPVDVSFTDNTGSVAGADSINVAPSSNENTDSNGEVEFTFSVTPGANIDDIEEIVRTDDLVFEATEGDDVTTAENSIEFVPDIGDTGTISGTITNVGEGQQLGTQSNLAEPEDIRVYAVQQDDVDTNTETISDGDGLNETVPSDLSADYSADFTDVRFDESDIFRVVTFDDDGTAVPRDPRSDYLTTTTADNADLELIQNESVPGVQIHQTDSDPAANNIDFTFLESGNFTVQQRVSYTNTSDAEDVEYRFKNVSTTGGGSTDDLAQIADSESITYNAISERFDSERAVPNDTTTSSGDFALLNLPTNQDGTAQSYTVIAGQGQAADGADQIGFANFGGFVTDVPVQPNADNDAAQQNVDLSVQEFQPVTNFNFNLDVTVDNGQKFVETPVGEPVSVEVTATQEEVGSDEAPVPAQGIDIELDDLNDNIGALADTTVTTDSNGEASTTFTGDSPNVGETNISATFDAGDDVFTTEGGEQATVDVFQDAQITGDVVDDSTPSNNLPGAEVTLTEENATGTFVEIANTTAGPGGSFSFTGADGVRSGESYTVEASFTDEAGNQGTGFAQITNIPGGTTNADIVIEDVIAPEGFEIQDGSLQAPAEAAPGDEIEVSANITNTAGEEATSDVTFVFNGSDVTSQEITLDAGETGPVSFTVTVPDVADGDYQHGIDTDIDSERATLNVTTADGGNSSEVPTNWELSEEQYFAIYENGEQPGSQEVSAVVNEWFNSDDGTVGDTEFTTQEISNAVNYWFNDQ